MTGTMATISPERGQTLAPVALHGLGAVDPPAWDAMLAHPGGALGHAFLSAWQRVEIPGLLARPLIVRQGGSPQPLAAAAGYLYDLDLSVVQHPILPPLVRRIRGWWPRFLVMRIFELGAPCAHVDPLMLAAGVDARVVVDELVREAVAEAERSGAQMVVVQDLVAPGGPLAGALRAHRFASVPTLPTVVLELRWETFDGYLAAMRAKYRNRARRVMRDSAHLRIESFTDFGEYAEEFARLWRLVYERASETKREILTPGFFREAAALDELSALILRRPDGSIAAFGLLMDDRPWLQFLQCGFSAAAGHDEAAYFRLTFEVVRAGIEGGYDTVNLGCTTLGPKLDLGGRPVGLSAWIRHRNPLLQRLFATGGNGRFAPPPAEPRRVFSEPG